MDLEQKIQLLSLVSQKIEDTGRFNHFAFVDTFAKNKPELNQSEQLGLLYLLQKQIKATGQLDYLPFVEQLGLKIEPVAESLPQSSTHTEPAETEKVIDATYNDIPQIPESLEIPQIPEVPEVPPNIVIFNPPPAQEQVNKTAAQLEQLEKAKRRERKLDQQNLLTLVMQQVNHSGRFDYHPFELAQTNYQISPELQLLHRIQQEVERTGRFAYHDFQQNVSNIC